MQLEEGRAWGKTGQGLDPVHKGFCGRSQCFQLQHEKATSYFSPVSLWSPPCPTLPSLRAERALLPPTISSNCDPSEQSFASTQPKSDDVSEVGDSPAFCSHFHHLLALLDSIASQILPSQKAQREHSWSSSANRGIASSGLPMFLLFRFIKSDSVVPVVCVCVCVKPCRSQEPASVSIERIPGSQAFLIDEF